MKFLYLWIILLLLSYNRCINAQAIYQLEGQLISNKNNDLIAYANVFNLSLKKGTISNTEGYFKISYQSLEDSIRISSIGYKTMFIQAKYFSKSYTIKLDENEQLLNEITIKPTDQSYLIEMLLSAKKNKSLSNQTGKAYYELKSNMENKQVELVEGYYNVAINNYCINNMELKAGRIALQKNANRFFTSLESSRAILALNISTKNDYFPIHPLALNETQVKNKFYIVLDNLFIDNNHDSIYVINYMPKDSSGKYFSGNIWVNKTKNYIQKIDLITSKAITHPFMPLFNTDSIAEVALHISQSYTYSNHQVLLNYTNFVYTIQYNSRINAEKSYNYSICTRAVLYVYDYNHLFQLPFFKYTNNQLSDYRKINAMPYNPFFWQYNDEYRMNDSTNLNAAFFNDILSITNKTLFTNNTIIQQSFFEHPYMYWSTKRVKINEAIADSSKKNQMNEFPAEQYHLGIKIYLDINTYNDSTDHLTSTIFDPYDSYYHLPVDNMTLCFINIFFDLCEIQRIALEKKLHSRKYSSQEIEEIYNNFLIAFEKTKKSYLEEVQRGNNKSALLTYNNLVYEKLGIDNMQIFKIDTK